jgi:hypothetical protein
MSDSHSSDERRRILAEQIAREEQHISEIDAELEHRRALVSSFKEQLAAIEPVPTDRLRLTKAQPRHRRRSQARRK